MAPRFELGIEALQAPALPLGYATTRTTILLYRKKTFNHISFFYENSYLNKYIMEMSMKFHSGIGIRYNNVVIDSRKAVSGDLFFALKGENVDGHDFLENAAKKGAVSAIISKDYTGSEYGLECFRVDDTLSAMQNMARDVLQKRKSKIVGVTGSLGKTTTRDFMVELLSQRYRVAATPHNYNGKIGLPLSILNADPAAEIIVLEMGIDSPDGLSLLTNIAPPIVAVITTIDFVHSEFYEDIKAIAEAKSKIFDSSSVQLGVVNMDTPHYDDIITHGYGKKVSFSVQSPSADYHISMIDGFMVIFAFGDKVLKLKWHLPEHYKCNFLAAVAAARYFGLSWSDVAKGFAQLKLPKRRFEIIEKKGVTFIDDSYNACKTSIIAALKNLPRPVSGGKTVAVIGEMKELGLHSEQSHHDVAEFALEYVDHLFCLGEGCRPMYDIWTEKKKPICWMQDKKELVAELQKTVNPGDVVLLKGANSNKLSEILQGFE